MKHQWMAYAIVAVLSVGAGVAIAGLPSDVPVDATIIPPTTTEAPASTLPSTTVPAATAPPTTEVPATTDVTDTTVPTGTTEPEQSLPDRSDIVVAAANGAGVGGAAGRAAAELVGLGYVDVAPLDGSDVVDLTFVYHADGFEVAAARLAEDLSILPELVAPLADAPVVVGLPDDVELLAYVGTDRA